MEYFGDTPKHTNKEKTHEGKGCQRNVSRDIVDIPYLFKNILAKRGSVMFVLRMLPQVLWCLFDSVLVLMLKKEKRWVPYVGLCTSQSRNIRRNSDEALCIQRCSIMIRTKTSPFYVGASVLFLIAGKGCLSTLVSMHISIANSHGMFPANFVWKTYSTIFRQ